jgi:hypothetical protein
MSAARLAMATDFGNCHQNLLTSVAHSCYCERAFNLCYPIAGSQPPDQSDFQIGRTHKRENKSEEKHPLDAYFR